jgi:hypothetical protein
MRKKEMTGYQSKRKMRMAMTPEAKVKKRVVEFLKLHNIYYFFPATGGYGRSGVPDIVACHEGRFIGIECKAGSNKPTALQARELESITTAGGLALLINEDTLHELDKIL